jgi:aryl-alcohol dehydrogenase-like predicted oxidoreductase
MGLLGYREMIELGLGLLSIGRPWGVRQAAPPSEAGALALLEAAASLGIRFFDTAPAYGASEAILGRFLRTRRDAFVTTKMGEWWDPASGASMVDHRLDSLKRSIDRSLALLGSIDLLQVHKASADNLLSEDVARAIEYARGCGIRSFGASVPDLAAAAVACESSWCTWLQFPYNSANTALAGIFPLARAKGMRVIVNRPFAMGALAAGAEAFAFVRRQDFDGVVLTGTGSVAHLRENHAAFSSLR